MKTPCIVLFCIARGSMTDEYSYRVQVIHTGEDHLEEERWEAKGLHNSYKRHLLEWDVIGCLL